ncbi:phage minor head protein [Streptomyces sp. BSE6.1]|uniref:phage minor head protein n=1 Tax=Streptomyces sp. BSE6.1 TaxID=2605730 RepID=UPI001F1BF381|nr:phage minor head protein [Streptomyces sp. BSE6.1]
MADDLESALAAAEADVADTVRAVLDEIAAELDRELAEATEIVAARFSLARIGRAWTARVPRIMRRLLSVAGLGGRRAADDTDGTLPPEWDDLPGRYDDGTLPASLGDYVEGTEHLLRAVGDRLTEAAVAALAEGLDAGEDTEQLRARLRALLAADGQQLGDVREQRVARTEASRAWNAATLAAAQDMTGTGRPLAKQWITRMDSRVRDAHEGVNGQMQLLADAFTVAGVPMQYPGDPSAPASLTVNCRCVLRLAPEDRLTAAGSKPVPAGHVYETKDPTLIAAATEHTGAMIALIPSAADAERLALDDGEPVDELHCTLAFLGTAADWTTAQRTELIDSVRAAFGDQPGPVTAYAFGINHWNPASDDPAWVYAVSDQRDDDAALYLQDAHQRAAVAIADTQDRPEIPRQHAPWVAHVTGAYTTETWPLAAMADRLGDVTFDRVRVAFAGENTDIPLGPEEEPQPMSTTAAAEMPPVRTWTTPDDTALAYENEQTGDGRLLAEGALYWDSAGPWPLQYADEMGMGHEGAELAGSIENIGRDGARIPGSGVLYLTQRAGYEAATLLLQKAPLGVSVDLDDVSIELVDNTGTAGQDDLVLAAAAVPSASVLHLDDGGWMLTTHGRAEWTASGAAMSRARATTQVISGPGGQVTADTARQLFPDALTAAAGDPDDPDGVVVHSENAGDYLMRITRARVRGATLVAMPAYSRARIVLDDLDDEDQDELEAAAASGDSEYERVVRHVAGSPVPVDTREVANACGIGGPAASGHLRRAVRQGHLRRVGVGLYAGASSIPEGPEATASAETSAFTMSELEASAWQVMQQAPPMPADWFREPTREELPPDSGGVHYKDGRVYGWVAQAGVPHAVHGRKVQIDKLGKIDTSHFLRAKFTLDDGSEIAVGTITMDVGHHRDGFQCETAACQFDNSGTVAGIVTVGMNRGGMWFSGAAAPWLSEWDLSVFRACQPSYHMERGSDGRWQLKAVLSVPVPGHSSRLDPSHVAASAVVERSNLALTAAAAVATPPQTSPPAPAGEPETSADDAVSELAAALLNPAFLDKFTDALIDREAERTARQRAEIQQLAAQVGGLPNEEGN